MASTSEKKQRLKDIDSLLAAGTNQIVIDGVTISLDLKALKSERATLEKQLKIAGRKPPCYRVNLGG